MDAVVVDTDVVSYTFKKDSRARRYQQYLVGKQVLISFMTLAELDRWALDRRWGQARRDRLDRFLLGFTVVHSDRDLCRVWAEVTQQANQVAQPIDCADAWIAAVALFEGVPLVTNNPEDYASVIGLSVLSSSAP